MKLRKSIPAILLAVFILSACSDNDNGGIKLQAHDQNAFMMIMHTMNSKMDAVKMTGDADQDFATMMIEHHQGAIDMANKELEKGDDATIKSMAQNIIDKQAAEKAKLTAWLQSHTSTPNSEGEAFDAEMMKEMEKMKNWKDIQVLTGDADNDFAALMIIHHQAASDNASAILHHGHHDDIKEMAKMMIEDQGKEITDFTSWLKSRGATKQ